MFENGSLMHGFQLSIIMDDIKKREFYLDVKNNALSQSCKINIILTLINQMLLSINNGLKQVLTTCTKQYLKAFNGTNY